MSTTIMPNAITTGTRRLSTLGAMWGLGTAVDPSTIADLVANGGYDMGTINTLMSMGASNEQLLALPYPAAPDEMAAAVSNLMNQLGGALPTQGRPATTARSYPQGAIPIVQTDLGVLDLSLRATWDNLTSQFTQIGQQLNAIAAQNPNDPAVIQMRSQYNSAASQFSAAWSKVFSGSSPISTLGDWTDVAVGSGFVVIGGILIATGVGIPLVAVIVGVAATLAVVVKWINSRNAQTAVSQTAAQTQSTLAQQLAAAQARGDTATAQKILDTMAAAGAGAGSAPMNWNVWLQQNVGLLVAGLAAIVIVPPLLRRR